MEPRRSWTHCTSTLRALSFRFAVYCDDEALGRHIEALLSSLADPEQDGQAPYRYMLAPGSDPRNVDVWRNDELVQAEMTTAEAIGWLMWDVNRAAAEASGRHLLLHAGGLEAEGRGVLVPGPSGSGKSTLTAGLARAGLGYLSDELVALDLASPRLLPYPKPITLKAGSFAVLRDLAPSTGPPGNGTGREPDAHHTLDAQEWQVPVGADTGRRVGDPCVPAFVVVPRYDPARATELVRLSETDAFFALALSAVNLIPHRTAGAEALGRLATGCECFSLRVSDLGEACQLVLDLMDRTEATLSEKRGAQTSEVGHGR